MGGLEKGERVGRGKEGGGESEVAGERGERDEVGGGSRGSQ